MLKLMRAGALVFIGVLAAPPVVGQTPQPTTCPVVLPLQFTPALVGLTTETARELADQVGYTIEIVEEESGEVDPGSVIGQDPSPGVLIDPGTTITVTVATEPTGLTGYEGKSYTDLKEIAKRPKYKDLLRRPESFEGKPIYFRGEVLQAQDDGDGGQFMLVSVTRDAYGFWDDNIAVSWSGEPRVIPDDIIQFVMIGTGNFGYESAGAGYLTVPSGQILRLRIDK